MPPRVQTAALRAGLLAAAGLAGCAAVEDAAVLLELDAGAHARTEAALVYELPQGLRGARAVRLERSDTGEAVPVQVLEGGERIAWIARGTLAARTARRYLLSASAESPAERVQPSVDDSGVTLSAGERELLRYHATPTAPPAGVDDVYARSAYVHPLRSPSGRTVTGDSPPSHRHQHGVFAAWTRTRFEGRELDFWNAAEGVARIECAGLEGTGGGAVLASLRARQQHVDLSAPGGPRAALEETWELVLWDTVDRTQVDLSALQRCGGPSALEVLEHTYGGFAWRGPLEWEGDAVQFMTSEGAGRVDGDGSRARWCAAWGEVDGAPVTVAWLAHPGNPRAPEPLRIHPSNPYFCWAPCRLGAFEIAPGEPHAVRYRIVVVDGPPDAERIEGWWRDWVDPPRVRVVEARG